MISSLLDDDFDTVIGLSSGLQDGDDLDMSITGVRPLSKNARKDGTLIKKCHKIGEQSQRLVLALRPCRALKRLLRVLLNGCGYNILVPAGTYIG